MPAAGGLQRAPRPPKGRKRQPQQPQQGEVAVHEDAQHGPQGLGRQVAGADDAEQAPPLPHVEHHRRHAPKLEVGEQVDDAVAGHQRHGRPHRLAGGHQHAQPAGEGHHGQQHVPGQAGQGQAVLVVAVHPAGAHHGKRRRCVGQG